MIDDKSMDFLDDPDLTDIVIATPNPAVAVNPLLLRRLALSVVPFTLIGAVVLLAIFGDHGLIRRHQLRLERMEAEERLAQIEHENADLRRQMMLLDAHPIGLERLAAEQLLMAAPGSTIYRFPDEEKH